MNSRNASRKGKGTSDISTATGSDVYRSVRSDLSDLQSCQYHISMNRSPAIIVPSPTCQRPLEVVGLPDFVSCQSLNVMDCYCAMYLSNI